MVWTTFKCGTSWWTSRSATLIASCVNLNDDFSILRNNKRVSILFHAIYSFIQSLEYWRASLQLVMIRLYLVEVDILLVVHDLRDCRNRNTSIVKVDFFSTFLGNRENIDSLKYILCQTVPDSSFILCHNNNNKNDSFEINWLLYHHHYFVHGLYHSWVRTFVVWFVKLVPTLHLTY